MSKKKDSRRSFIKKTTTAGIGISIVPSHVVAGLGHTAPSDKLNIVGVGVGGKGFPNLRAMDTENIIGLCDIDWNYSKPCFDTFPKASKYYDWRKMFDELGSSMDAVMIATADHTHAAITATAMTMGKHVYCQKPLTHSVYESRLLTKLAAEYPVATQMGNQGNSGDGVRQLCEWVWNGEIGEIVEAHAWTDRPIWPQGLERPKEKMKIPQNFNWELFIGPANMRPYHEVYTPWNWRGWWDFGTGAFGDMACHVLDPIYRALKLGYPNAISGSSTTANTESPPQAEKVLFSFPAREDQNKIQMPAVDVHWYDGGILPDRPEGLPDDAPLIRDGLGGCMLVGTKDTLISDCGGFNPRLLSGRIPEVTPYLRRVPGSVDYSNGPHEQDWIRACKEAPENRTQGSAHFGYAGPFNEMVLLGVLAIRLQGLNKILQWDGEAMEFTNISASETMEVVKSFVFEMVNGRPKWNVEHVELNALEAAQEYIKHTYKNGWSLPQMPS
ncbi:Gfo/Idh/MocA family protein [Muriicola sp. Z0-33]|uniref:Gfo/Idh/MocA family protein n=1 Tax=Muriicola sp. Z0-33 TaxID=2816957 RepID=UPI0022378490|nr:Gfo/Idh/MocA family oxidoreductase [Muriicola sp. Z0-33]MCW5516485.1 Gfo/Idh/MocA family oxidoreductase [Muriicola sp. Z0-33]